MRKLIITAITTVALIAAAGASTAFALLGQSHVDTQRATTLHNLSVHHIRSLPLWMPG